MNQSTTANASATAQKAPDRTWSQWWRRVRLPTILIGLLFLIILGLIYFQAALVVGTELNAHTWQVRQFSFRRDPFTNTQLSGISYSTPKYLAAWHDTPDQQFATPNSKISKYLNLSSRPAERWDLIQVSSSTSSPGQASILIDLLQARDYQYDEVWPKWTTDNPGKAKILWPAVQDLVALELYAKLPRAFELTRVASSLEEFQSAVVDYVQSTVLEHCQRLTDQGKFVQAVDAARIALNYNDHDELQAIVDADRQL